MPHALKVWTTKKRFQPTPIHRSRVQVLYFGRIGARKRFQLVDERLSIIRFKGDCLVIARQRIVETLEILQRIATVVERIGIIRFKDDCLVVARQRIVETLEC
nr:hypothetical protein [Sphingorhabdus sp. EL138]